MSTTTAAAAAAARNSNAHPTSRPPKKTDVKLHFPRRSSQSEASSLALTESQKSEITTALLRSTNGHEGGVGSSSGSIPRIQESFRRAFSSPPPPPPPSSFSSFSSSQPSSTSTSRATAATRPDLQQQIQAYIHRLVLESEKEDGSSSNSRTDEREILRRCVAAIRTSLNLPSSSSSNGVSTAAAAAAAQNVSNGESSSAAIQIPNAYAAAVVEQMVKAVRAELEKTCHFSPDDDNDADD